MKKIPKEDRLKFYKFLNAGSSFEQVERISEYMLTQKIVESHLLFYPLTLSIFVIYGRPFKQRKNIRLPTWIVPKELQSTHDFLILCRDKVFAHTDTDGPKYDEKSSVNELMIVTKSRELEAHWTTVRIRDTTLEKIRNLSRILTKKTVYQADKVWNKYMKKYPFPDGNYHVNIGDREDDFLLPSKS